MSEAVQATGYGFLAGADPYSDGVVSRPGFEIIHVTLASATPWRGAVDRVIDWLDRRGRPPRALCAIELRSPAPRSFAGFAEFNDEYRQMLIDYSLLVDGRNPVARTNVAPTTAAPDEVVLHAFSFSTESDNRRRTFVTSGAGELRADALDASAVVRPGDRSDDGLRAKADHVLATMSDRLRRLGCAWGEATTIDVYTAGEYLGVTGRVVANEVGASTGRGLHWFPSRPPVADLDFEMDARGVERELVVHLPR